MSDCVVDASALVLALSGKGPEADVLRERLAGRERHAPHLIDAEVGGILRRHERSGFVSAAEASAALLAGRVLVSHRYPHVGPLGELAWGVCRDLSFSGALYVALAAQLDAPLITCDRRLADARSLPCVVELA